MRKELDKTLVERYPKIFADRHGDMKETAMCWGFDCGDGWYWLIDNLCSSIQSHIDYNDVPQVTAIQVKEKFGGLRFYFNGGNDYIDGMTSLVESMSYTICEECGSTVNVKQTDGWVYTRCDKCMEKIKK